MVATAAAGSAIATTIASENGKAMSVVSSNTLVAISDTTITVISVQALIRHQSQRSSRTRPVPARIDARNFQAPAIDGMSVVAKAPSPASTSTAMRATRTSSRSPASGRAKRRYTSWVRYDAPQLSCVSIVDMKAASSVATIRPRAPLGRCSSSTRT